jgi:hypothetical protein
LQKLISHRFSQNIWRILPDTDPASNLWVVELRDVSEKKVEIALLDTQTGQLLWQVQPDGADWWTSLTAFSNGRIYLHNYRYPEVPEPTDLLVVSAKTGSLEELISNHILVKTCSGDLIEVATKVGDRFLQKYYNVALGEFVPVDEKAGSAENLVILKEPVRYTEGNVYFEKLRSFIHEKVGGPVASGIDYLEVRPYMIFSYYIYEQDKTVQYLLIVTDQMETVLHETLSEEREGMGRSTMLLKASTLVYLKNNNEFSSLTLSL